jgi:hypothetical protein
MVKLSLWEQILISTALSFLTVLAGTIKNPTELAGIQAAITFLQKLLAEQVSTT